jgi:acetylornithine deacetylase
MQRANTITTRTTEILEKLVAFDSVSSNSNLPIIGFIEGYLKAYRVHCARVMSPDKTKSNLLARIGPDIEGGVVLSGHTDVVPVAGQSWDTDPFKLTENAGRFYGRGAADMKSFVAACLAMVPIFTQAKLQKPIWFAFSYDEEVGCLGAPHLLDYITANIPKPSFVIIGEPTMMQVVTAHKGVHSYETRVHGLEWHSSQTHLGVNAVQTACELVHFLKELNDELAQSGLKDERFNPSHSTVHVGTIHGGTARNIIPKECVFQWEIRPLPNENPEALYSRFTTRCLELLEAMRKLSPQADITTTSIAHMDGVSLPVDAIAARELVMHCAKTNQEQVVSYGTEAGVFQHHGIPAIICGPGDIQQAHKPNEFIDRSQIQDCVHFLFSLCESLSEKTSA